MSMDIRPDPHAVTTFAWTDDRVMYTRDGLDMERAYADLSADYPELAPRLEYMGQFGGMDLALDAWDQRAAAAR